MQVYPNGKLIRVGMALGCQAVDEHNSVLPLINDYHGNILLQGTSELIQEDYMLNETIRSMTKEQLLELMEIDAKDSVALDGVWFQSVERKFGMDEAMYHDEEAWKRFSPVEARRLKKFLGLGEHPGLEGLAKALPLHIVDRAK